MKKLKVGVIGVGLIGKYHLQTLKMYVPNAEITAVADNNTDATRTFLGSKNIEAEIFNDGHKLLKSRKIDAAIICTLNETHEEFVISALEACVPVLSEKPLSMTSKGCLNILKKENEFDKQMVWVGYMRRYDDGYRTIKRAIEEGTVGHPLIIRCAHRNPFHHRNKGDMALEEAFVHEIDMIRWLTQDEYESVQVITPRQSSLVKADAKDPHIVILKTKDGIYTETEIFIDCQYGYDMKCEVVGEKGVLNLPQPNKIDIRTDGKNFSTITMTQRERFGDAYRTEIQEWVNMIVNGESGGSNVWDSYVIASVVEASVKSKHNQSIEKIEFMSKEDILS